MISLQAGNSSGREQKRRRRMRRSSRMMIEDDDLASLIFCRLPARSVLRFRCVSRRLLALTSEPTFLRSHTLSNPHPPVAGLIVEPDYQRKQLLQAHPIPSLIPSSLPDPSIISFSSWSAADFPMLPDNNLYNYMVHPLDSCSGLILIKAPSSDYKLPHYVCNPTTMEFRGIPDPPTRRRQAIALFFDPSSPACRTPILHYKLICICNAVSAYHPTYPFRPRYDYRIFIYNSLTASWTAAASASGNKSPFFFLEGGISIPQKTRAAACGGAVHWPSESPYRMLSFSVESERFWVTPFPLSPTGGSRMFLGYFGSSSSGDRLHLIQRYHPYSFDPLYIYELKEDLSGWLLLYSVNLIRELYNFLSPQVRVSEKAPVCFLRKVQQQAEEEEEGDYKVVRGGGGGGIIKEEEEEEDLLVLNVIDNHGKMRLITYNLQKKIFYNKVTLLPGYLSSGSYNWDSFTPSTHSLYPLHH